MLPNPFVLFCVFGCRNWRWLAATNFSLWDLRSSYPYFADDQPTVGIFFLISDMNQVLLSLLLDYVETNQPLRYLWNIIIIKGRLQNPTAGWPAVVSGFGRLSLFRTIATGRNWTEPLVNRRLGFEAVPKVKQHGWRHGWLNRHDLCLFLRLFNLEPKIHYYYTDDFACLYPQFLQTELYRYCSLIFETVCIRITVILIIRFVFEEAFNWCLCLGSTLFTAFFLQCQL